MAVLSDISGVAYWTALAQQLLLEAQAQQGDVGRHAALNRELYRVLADRLDKSRSAHQRIDAAAAAQTGWPDVAWESWRASTGRDSGSQSAALERLVQIAEQPEVQAACYLALARLRQHHLADPEGAERSLSDAELADPDSRGVIWSRSAQTLAAGDEQAAVPHLEQLAAATQDPIWRAALQLELASIERRAGADAEQVAAHLSSALEQPGADWTIVHEVMRTSAAIGAHELAERALTRIAEAALEPPPQPADDRPPGHTFDAYKRGPAVAAAHYFMMSLLREREGGDPERALESLQRAIELDPDSSFLGLERARLLEANKRFADALGALADGAPSGWRAELALAAGQPALAVDLARRAAAESTSLLPQTIAEVAELMQGATATAATGPQDPAQWLVTNPDHPDAPAVARDLISTGADLLLARLLLDEREAPDRAWPAPEHTPEGASWTTALDVVRGDEKAGSSAYLRWAEQAATQDVKALLVAAAARAAENSADSETALDLSRQALELDSSHTESAERLIRLLRELGKWSELADLIAEQADGMPDTDSALAALHERAIVLEYALADPSSAVEALDELVIREPDDVAAALSQVRLALQAADWIEATERLRRLAELCPEDAPRLELLAGELLLLALDQDADGAERFARAAAGLDGALAQAARLYRIYCAYLKGEAAPLDELLRQELLDAPEDVRELWLPEVLEAARSARGAAAAAEMLDAGPTPSSSRQLWQLMSSAAAHEQAAVAQNLDALAEACPRGALAGACRTAAVLLDDARAGTAMTDAATDAGSAEVLWHAADRLEPDADPALRADLLGRRAELSREREPLEWADWMLCRAEAQVDAGDSPAALSTISAALEEVAMHPGLLETKVELCLETGDHEAAIDACKRLARFYPSEEEQTAQLARAAAIIYAQLGDARGAEKVVRQALRLTPGHEGANEVLTRILNDRGDDEALARQIEDRIEAEYDSDSLVELYQEQADRLFAVDDMRGALDAIDNLLLLAPTDHGAHRTKVDILLGSEQPQEAFQAMMEFIEVLEEPIERRSMIWRAAELRADQLDEIDEAIAMLGELVEAGDRHPQTFRYVAHIAKRGNRWEEAAEALARLAEVVDDPAKKLEAWREEARIQLESLFDPDAAAAAVDKALAIHASDLELIVFASDFREEEDTREALRAAEDDLRAKLDEEPVDPQRIATLQEVAQRLGQDATARQCRAVIAAIEGAPPAAATVQPQPTARPDPAQVRERLTHPEETGSAAAAIARACAPMTKAVYGRSDAIPETGRSTLVGKRSDDPVRAWLKAWAELVGIEAFELHRVGSHERGSIALPGSPPAVAVVPDCNTPLVAADRFYLARHLWRSDQGLGPFQEGDTAGPVRWIIAVTMAALGDDARPPLPTDSDLVALARKAMSRKIRKIITEPCRRLIDETPQTIRAWVAGATYSADRFGLLAADDLAAVVRPVVEESAGEAGLKRLDAGPAEALSKVPRGIELVRFAVSPDLIAIKQLIGLLEEGAR